MLASSPVVWREKEKKKQLISLVSLSLGKLTIIHLYNAECLEQLGNRTVVHVTYTPVIRMGSFTIYFVCPMTSFL